jgi:hypothetical protein
VQVSLLNAPLIRVSFSVSIHSDHVRLADDKNRFKVVLPDQLLESVFSGYYEVRYQGSGFLTINCEVQGQAWGWLAG